MKEKIDSFKIKKNYIYNIDCIDLINKMIEKKILVDSIITDPPYNISRKNNFKTINRSGIDFGDWDKKFDQLKWLNNISKIVKPGGSIIIFNDWKNLGKISKKLEEEGFEIKDLLRWVKPSPMPRNVKRRYVTDFELALWAVKPGKWTFNKPEDEVYARPEFKGSPPMGKKRIHPTQKSSEVIKKIIKIHTNEGDLIFDPFSGSGEISYCANELNREYIGSEINELYYKSSIKRIKNSFIKPAFNHLGNKYRMIDELLRQFPKKDIHYFIDVFAGSGIVSLSYKSPKKIFLNDKDKWLSKILDYIFNNSKDIIINDIENIIKKYNLPIKKTEYKNEFNKLKIDFNKTKEIPKLFVLILFGFNQQIRFNSKNEFNIPVGKFWWNDYHKEKIINFIDNIGDRNITIKSQNFDIFINNILNEIDKKKTIFYFDPPYLLSNATYNNNWSNEDEINLINILQKLTDEGYKWFLSNIIESKGKTNNILKEFIEKNKDKIEYDFLNDINYKNSNYQRKNNNFDKEILVKGFKNER